MLFKRKKKEATPKSIKPKECTLPSSPEPNSFNFLEIDTWTGTFVVPSARIAVSLAYSDWCELQRSKIFHDFERYLLELQKRDNQISPKEYQEQSAGGYHYI